MLVLGLTGSIATGKSTAAATFAAHGAAIFDADSTVHALYSGRAALLIEAAFPGTVSDGAVSRPRLAAALAADPAALLRLEAIVHPLVHEEENAFLARAARAGRRLAVLDIPLLLETGGARRVDAVVVVTVAAEIQRQRALARRGMTEARLAMLLARQMPAAEKIRHAHFVIDTGGPMAASAAAARDIVRALAAAAAAR